MTVLAALGLIFASVYSLWVIQKVFHGEFDDGKFHGHSLMDLDRREMTFYIAMMLGLLWMGMYPQSFLALSQPVLDSLLAGAGAITEVAGQL
jgi:NADH-quinone oxidoreductase subunit M